MINKSKWEELPKQYKAVITAAAQATNCDMMARYDALNPTALRKLVAGGAKLRPFPLEVLEACFKASNETFDEIAAENADFKKIYESMVDRKITRLNSSH